MRRVGRTMLVLCSAASAALLALAAVGHVAAPSLEFTLRGVRWQATFAGGMIRVDDGPQQRLEQASAQSLAASRHEDALRQHEAAQAALMRAPGGSGGGGTPDELRQRRRARRDAVMRLHELTMAAGAHFAPPTSRPPAGFAFPVLAAALVMGIPPLAFLAGRRRRRRRLARGLCVTCGYDLRATPGRCPECGAAVSLR